MPEWREAGFRHGFLGKDVDISKGKTEWLKSYEPKPLLLLKQVHGTDLSEIVGSGGDVLIKSLANADSAAIEADAWVVDFSVPRAKDFCFGIKTADCIPVIVRSCCGRFAAAVHCGWRGTVNGLLPIVIEKLTKLGARRLQVAVGPGAGECCYEISKDLAVTVREAESNSLARANRRRDDLGVVIESDGKFYCSLKRLLCLQAISSGVEEADVFLSNLCTICDIRFFSFRREKEQAGRQVSYIAA